MKKEEKMSLIYLIQMGDTQYYKIGITKDINRRIRDLQTGNPLPLTVVTTIEIDTNPKQSREFSAFIESRLHALFEYCRASGEWFKFVMQEEEDLKKWGRTKKIENENDFLEFIKMTFDYENNDLQEKIDNFLN